ncbi:MAG TPA: hypothetical protein DEQ84_07900 [Prevotellaceae bacterium]|nr:hypothetical protein [Prevotellaceae bacterium]
MVITTELPATFHVVLKDRGSQLLNYQYAGLPAINLDFRNYDRQSGHVVLSPADIVKLLQQRLSPTTKIVSYKAERLEYYFNNGLNVRLPVELKANLKTEQLYGISSIRVIPDSVTAYAMPEVLDTLRSAITQSLNLANISESLVCKVNLAKMRGVKFDPSSVRVKINVDQMTEKSVDVPVKRVNFPAGKTLRTFPSKVKIIFQVGMSMYRKITADDFTLVVNYETLLKATDGKIQLYLKSVPAGVSHVRIVPSTVDFLIEDVVEEDS